MSLADPDAILALLLDAFRADDREAATAALDDLCRWINRGGRLPLAQDAVRVWPEERRGRYKRRSTIPVADGINRET